MAGKDTKTRIKEIGLKLFQERGFENVTINEICEQSGVNKHTFYYYFKSKDELLKDYYELPYDIGTKYFVQDVYKRQPSGLANGHTPPIPWPVIPSTSSAQSIRALHANCARYLGLSIFASPAHTISTHPSSCLLYTSRCV